MALWSSEAMGVMDWMFMSLPNSYVEILNPNAIVLGKGVFGNTMWLGNEGRAFMNGINDPIIRDTP